MEEGSQTDELVSEMMQVKPILLEDKIEKLLREGYDEKETSSPKEIEIRSDQSPETNTVLSGNELKKSNYINQDLKNLRFTQERKESGLLLDVSDSSPEKSVILFFILIRSKR